MKEYCTDLKIAKELKEAGFPQNSMFYFMRQDELDFEVGNVNPISRKEWALSLIISKDKKEEFLADFGHPDKWMGIQPEHFISAPFSGEVLKELPKEIEDKFCYFLEILCLSLSYNVFYQSGNKYELIGFHDKKLSNSLAKMWLYLKKEGYIK